MAQEHTELEMPEEEHEEGGSPTRDLLAAMWNDPDGQTEKHFMGGIVVYLAVVIAVWIFFGACNYYEFGFDFEEWLLP